MLKRISKWPIGLLLALCVLLSMLPIYNRVVVEGTQTNVETAVSYYDLLRNNLLEEPATNQLLLSGNLTTLVLSETNLGLLQLEKKIRVVHKDELSPQAREGLSIEQQAFHTVVTFAGNDSKADTYYQEFIAEKFKDHSIVILEGNQRALLIKDSPESLLNSPLGIDLFQLEEIRRTYPSEVMIMLNNQSLSITGSHINAFMESLQRYHINSLFSWGTEVIAYPDRIGDLADQLIKHDIHFTYIRSQLGADKLAIASNYNMVRVIYFPFHTLQLMSEEQTADAYALAVRERGVRLIYIPLPDGDPSGAQKYIERLDRIIGNIKEDFNGKYSLAKTGPFAGDGLIGQAYMEGIRAFAAVGIFILAMLLTLILGLNRKLSLYSILGCAVIMLTLYITTDNYDTQIEAALGLLAGIITPVLSTLAIYRYASKISLRGTIVTSVLLFALTLLITTTGIIFIAALMSDTPYLTYVYPFRGVKLLYLSPILIVAGYLLIKGKSRLKAAIARIRGSRKAGMIVILSSLMVAAVLIYFVLRSGNSTLTLPFEGAFRSKLEDWFGVRPRTKEFLIAHPLYLLGLYMMISYKRGYALIVFGVLGQLSIINTFTHLHTPLEVSVIRTFIGLTLGLLIGLVLIFVFVILKRNYRRLRA